MDPLCNKHRTQNSGPPPGSNSLTDDLLLEVLLRLPADSANRFKCVSRHWLFFISSHYFSHQFNLRRPADGSISRHSLIFHHSACREFPYGLVEVASTEPAFKSLQSCYRTFLPVQPEDLEYFQLLGSSNGLVLCSAHVKKTKKSLDYCYYVCNPLTRHWIMLPPPPEHHMKYHHIVGFLCDTTNGISSFNVVIVFIPPFHSIFKIKIFSSENGDWSEYDVPCPIGFQWDRISRHYHNNFGSLPLLSPPVLQSVYSGKAVFCNRKLHWYGYRCVVAYDPFHSPSQSMLISLQEDFDDDRFVCIAASQGHIRLCTFGRELVIWELEDHNISKWCRKYHLVDAIPRFRELYPDVLIRGITNIASTEIDGNILYLFHPPHVIVFNMETERPERQECITPTYFYDDKAFPFVLPWWPTPVPGFNPQVLRKH